MIFMVTCDLKKQIILNTLYVPQLQNQFVEMNLK